MNDIPIFKKTIPLGTNQNYSQKTDELQELQQYYNSDIKLCVNLEFVDIDGNKFVPIYFQCLINIIGVKSFAFFILPPGMSVDQLKALLTIFQTQSFRHLLLNNSHNFDILERFIDYDAIIDEIQHFNVKCIENYNLSKNDYWLHQLLQQQIKNYKLYNKIGHSIEQKGGLSEVLFCKYADYKILDFQHSDNIIFEHNDSYVVNFDKLILICEDCKNKIKLDKIVSGIFIVNFKKQTYAMKNIKVKQVPGIVRIIKTALQMVQNQRFKKISELLYECSNINYNLIAKIINALFSILSSDSNNTYPVRSNLVENKKLLEGLV